MTKCIAITNSGSQCSRNAIASAEYCKQHASKIAFNAMSTSETLESEYRDFANTANRFMEACAREIKAVLNQNQIVLGVPLEHRVKEWSSIAEKIQRKDLALESVFDLDDLIGFRLILIFMRDIEVVDGCLRQQFNVLECEDTSMRLQDQQFGYQSFHYIIKMPSAWEDVPTLSHYGEYKAEVQVRTLSQHTWAAAEHKLQYKNSLSVPDTLRRSIYRISALLETVDLEFERFLTDRDNYLDTLDSLTNSVPINVDVLRQIHLDIWPIENQDKSTDIDLSSLIIDLKKFEIENSESIIEILKKHKAKVIERDRKAVEEARTHIKKHGEHFGTSTSRIGSGVYFTHVGLTRVALGFEHGQKWTEYNSSKQNFNDMMCVRGSVSSSKQLLKHIRAILPESNSSIMILDNNHAHLKAVPGLLDMESDIRSKATILGLTVGWIR